MIQSLRATILMAVIVWQTVPGTALPHLLVIDLATTQTVTAPDYLPRADQGAPSSLKDIQVFVY